MKYIKEQFDDFRSSTPAYAQWLLLIVAFLIVTILLTLLLTNRSKPVKEPVQETRVNFNINPKNIKFDNVKVGESERTKVNITVNVPVIIESIKIADKSFTTPNNCVYDETDDCTITVIYTPTQPKSSSNTKMIITWYLDSADDVVNTEEVSVDFSAYEEKPKQIERKPEPEPVKEPVVEPETPVEYEEPEPVNIDQDIDIIVRPNPFKNNYDEGIAQTKPVEPQQPPRQCSEFAIPGYDVSGNQIGWIKPERGTNYFYPFSDKTCSNPTGKYNLTTGIITSLADGSKIGTDSDHIGYRNVRDRGLTMPQLSAPQNSGVAAKNGDFGQSAQWFATSQDGQAIRNQFSAERKFNRNRKDETKVAILTGSGAGESVTSSLPYDRTFILRQFKPIPATIVSEVRADPSVYGCNKAGKDCDPNRNHSLPVRATVDRNVYSDDGRTIILPTGTLLMGYLDGELPGPYQAFGRMNIRWYQFVRPDGVEFNFLNDGQDPYSADAQGRMGVPGHGSTDYIEQMVMPLLTSLVPAAVNMIAPIADTVINQIDLDNNTVVQSGTIRSSEMAKQDIINTWNKITQKLLVDAIDNTVPPFSIAAGTRINVFSPVDLIVSCEGADNKKCSAITAGSKERRKWDSVKAKAQPNPNDASWVGQVRSFDLQQYCAPDSTGKWTIVKNSDWAKSGYEYRTVLLYCESLNYVAINNAKQSAYSQNVSEQAAQKYGDASYDQKTNTLNLYGDETQQKAYNTEVLGLKYDDEGNIMNPFAKPAETVEQDVLTCDDGNAPDSNGCCAGETFTDMGDAGWNCCPDSGGDCFPPITVE